MILKVEISLDIYLFEKKVLSWINFNFFKKNRKIVSSKVN